MKRLSEWASDELIYLDISKDDYYDLRRNDLGHPNRHTIFEILDDVSKNTFMPITVGGKIRTLTDIQDRLSRGADKISVNTITHEDKNFIREAAREFGSQCIVVSIDVKIIEGKHQVVTKGAQMHTSLDPVEWAKTVESLGGGEILLNSVDNDGMKNGYDIDLLDSVSSAVNIPVIAVGGAGAWEHFAEALKKTSVDAIAAANIFQHIDQSVYLAKKYLFDHKYCVRSPDLLVLEK